ncbi:uncharacterized protein LOC109594268 [Aethina tumida]|uniref:uncharacterized protein LOC109594268 n=1 Tax=Aethina tumida TaxID=116153 RepID=UPI0021493002|nr:uncharacterized protein LOC109594268 [Aethina tumida]
MGEEAETSKVEEQFRGSVARSDDITIREVEPKEITQEAMDLGMTPLPPHLINLSVSEILKIDLPMFDEDPSQSVSISSEEIPPEQIVVNVQVLRSDEPQETPAPPVIVPIQPEEPTVPVVEPLEDQAESVIEKKSEPTRESAEQRDVGAWELGVEKTRQAIVGMQEKSAPQRPPVKIRNNCSAPMINRIVRINRPSPLHGNEHVKLFFYKPKPKKLQENIRLRTVVTFPMVSLEIDEEVIDEEYEKIKESRTTFESKHTASSMDVLRGAVDSSASYSIPTIVQQTSIPRGALSSLETPSINISRRSIVSDKRMATLSEESALEATQPILPEEVPLEIPPLVPITSTTFEMISPSFQKTLPDAPPLSREEFIKIRQKRQKNIINIVKNCDKGNLTIDDVAEKPLTKRNVAIAFGDLLSLCKQKQVILITDENLYLQTIEKGSEIGEY